MTKRLYYDCAIQALYMMKEFGVDLEVRWNEEEVDSDFLAFKNCGIIGLEEMIDYHGKIYLSKESESIFKPKQGDRTIYGDSFYKNLVTLKLEKIRANGIRNNWTKERENEIVIRDNKHFFMPKQQEEYDNKDSNIK